MGQFSWPQRRGISQISIEINISFLTYKDLNENSKLPPPDKNYSNYYIFSCGIFNGKYEILSYYYNPINTVVNNIREFTLCGHFVNSQAAAVSIRVGTRTATRSDEAVRARGCSSANFDGQPHGRIGAGQSERVAIQVLTLILTLAKLAAITPSAKVGL